MKGQRGRPNQGKTKNLKERTISVYLPTLDLKHEWKGSAGESGLSLSQFIIEAVERYRAYDSDSKVSRTTEQDEDVASLKEELSKLKSNHAILEAAYEKNESDLKRLSELIEKRKQGPCDIELARDMIFTFRKRAKLKIFKPDMLFALGIKDGDFVRIQQVREVADFLIDLGLLNDSGGNWVWLGPFKHVKKSRVAYGEKVQTTR